MKKLIVMALFAVLFSGSLMAQRGDGMKTPRTPEQRAEMQTKHLAKDLALSADQQSKVKAIFLSRAVQVDSLRASQSMDKSQRMQQLKAAKTATDADMQKVLSADQYQKYLQIQEERMDKMQQRRQSRQGEK